MQFVSSSKFYWLFTCKNFENRLRSDKVTESLKVGTFLRHSVHIYIAAVNRETLKCSLSYKTRPILITFGTLSRINLPQS